MASSESYPIDERSKGKRYAKRCNYDKETVESIVKATPLVHVSFNAPVSTDSPHQFPTILPMLGAMGAYEAADADPEDLETHIYLHGSSASRLTRLTSNGPLPLCVSATVLDGYVLALTPFNHSCNYRSAVIFGLAERVTDEQELLYAMELITNCLIPDRWANCRSPPTKSEITATGILRVKIETASAKIRKGPPHDDRKDLKDEELVARTWTGVVPLTKVLGEPTASPDNRVSKVPSHVQNWVKEANASAKEQVAESLKD